MGRVDVKLTDEGVIVGAFQYMAPEQLEGHGADSRTDLFAMGAVLYEMVTGRPAFAGRSKSSVIAAILSSEPAPFGHTHRLVSPALERAVKHCLAKDPDERWQSAADLCDELRWIAAGGSAAGLVAPVVTRRKLREYLAWSLALTAALAYWQPVRERRFPPSSLRLSILLPPTEALSFSRDRAPIALSPDGKNVAYTVRRGDISQLYLRALNRLEPTLVPASDDAYNPFFSSDGQWVGFFAQGKLKKAAVAGGVPQDICASGDGIGASWGSDDMIYFTPLWTKGIWRVPCAWRPNGTGSRARAWQERARVPMARSVAWC